jgi:hypothetical protein
MTTETTAPDYLLSCPFCGAHPHHGLTKVEYDQLHGDPFQRGQVWCPKGHARITSTNLEMVKKEWNRRAGQAHADAGLLAALTAILTEADTMSMTLRRRKIFDAARAAIAAAKGA